jgi:cytochrome c5
VETHQHDKVFAVTFLAVLGFLGAFTLVIILIANLIPAPVDTEEVARARIAERLAPAGTVITDPEALLKVSAPAAAAREPMTAEQVLARTCNACHLTGVLDAPKNGDKAAWDKRLAATGGMAGLVKSAIAGKGAMPPKGGDPSLSEDEIKAAVAAMLK